MTVLPQRRRLRLPQYDYASAGAYFVTIVTNGRARLFGNVVDGALQPNDAGAMIASHWLGLPERFHDFACDAFVVMPDHLHGILVRGLQVDGVTRAATRAAPTVAPPTLGEVIGAFKSLTTNAYGRGVREHGWTGFEKRLWQRSYFDRVIRDQDELDALRMYIERNPAEWDDLAGDEVDPFDWLVHEP